MTQTKSDAGGPRAGLAFFVSENECHGKKILTTRAGHIALNAELKNLKSVERPAIIQAVAEAREHGDLSENAEYHSAREKHSFIEGRIKELEGILSLSEVIDPKTLSGGIKFGATVTIVDEDTDEEKKPIRSLASTRPTSNVVCSTSNRQSRVP